MRSKLSVETIYVEELNLRYRLDNK